ncbi:MAG: (Fe-S)-binding protein [Deltaproteobacteria bacterium]|nr:(Fe-S)-binding protein [Deltaproteobacteria bacterium]
MPVKGERLVPEGLLLLRDNILSKGNIFGASSKAKWAKGLGLPSQGETLFCAGCGYQFLDEAEATLSAVRALDKRSVPWERTLGMTSFLNKLGINLGEIYGRLTHHSPLSDNPLRNAVEVLQRMDIGFGYLAEEEPCCAAPLYFSGFQEEFASRATEAQRIVQERKFTKIIGMVPSCTYALRELFPRFLNEWEVEVRHFLEVVCEEIKKGKKFRLPQKIKATYHDPCVLSRYLGITEEPREILRAIKGVEFVDVERNKEAWSTCCGGGGGFEVIFPEISQILAVNRVHELLKTDASVIVTSCPGCLVQLREGVKTLKTQRVEVMDMAQLLHTAMVEE